MLLSLTRPSRPWFIPPSTDSQQHEQTDKANKNWPKYKYILTSGEAFYTTLCIVSFVARQDLIQTHAVTPDHHMWKVDKIVVNDIEASGNLE